MEERQVDCPECGENYDFNLEKGICPFCEKPYREEKEEK